MTHELIKPVPIRTAKLIDTQRLPSIAWLLFCTIWIIGAADFSGDYPSLFSRILGELGEDLKRYTVLISTISISLLALSGIFNNLRRRTSFRIRQRARLFVVCFTLSTLWGVYVALVQGVRLDFIIGDSRNWIVYLALFAINDTNRQIGWKYLYNLLLLVCVIVLMKLGLSLIYDVFFLGGINRRYLFKFSPFLLTMVFLALSMFIYSDRALEKRQYFLTFILCSIGVFFAQTRGLFLGAIAGMIIIFSIMTFKRGKGIVRIFFSITIIILIGAIVATITQNNITNAFGRWGGEDYWLGIKTRLSQAEVLWSMFKQHSLTGIGLGGYDSTYERYSEFSSRPYLQELEYLNLLAKLGIFGMVLLVSAFGFLFFECIRMARRAAIPEQRGLIVGLTAGLVALLVSSSTNPLYSSMYFHLYVVIILLALSSLRTLRIKLCQTNAQVEIAR